MKPRSHAARGQSHRRRPPAALRPQRAGSEGENQRILQELQVHQEELRQQNDQLRSTQLDLEAARDRYSDLYDMAPLPYLTLDRAGLVIEANKTCLTFIGLSPQSLMRRSFASLFPPDGRAALRNALARARRKGGPPVLQLRMQAAGGEVPVELHLRPTATDLIHTAIVDLSERERAEAERRALVVQAEAARAASAAKDQFLATLSHELRTPLTPVVASLSGLEPRLARGGPSLSELRDLVAMLRRNLDIEVRLIDDLLDASRVSFGKLALERQKVDLHGLVREAVSLLATEADRKGVRLEVELEARQAQVDGDPLRLRQVFWNLLRNAIKFTDQGGCVTVRSRSARQVITVEVRDTGIGIDSGDLPRVFDRFVQTKAGAQAGGLGLGLSIVHGIVEAHGGNVRAESAGRGRGSCFTVELACSRATGRPLRSTSTARPAPGREQPRPPAAGQRILLVDDHEETAAILAQLLRDEGYRVRVAHTMQTALRASREPFDLLVSDIGLPDGSGIELMRKLRPRLQVPAIALTGYGRQEDLDRSRAAGFDGHLVKPVEFPELLLAIQRLGGRH